MTRNNNRSGYILLFLLVVAVLILFGVMFGFKVRSGKAVKMEGVPEINNPPWQQWEKIWGQLARGGLGAPDSLQPKIIETMAIKTLLFENKRDRGVIILKFNPDLSIEGAWTDSFYIDPNHSREFDLAECVIKGYLVPDETCADVEKRTEPNNIYFLARGKFTLVDYNHEINKTRAIKGYIYLSGWLLPDFMIRDGQAVMTSEDEHLRMFDFTGKAEKMSVVFGFQR